MNKNIFKIALIVVLMLVVVTIFAQPAPNETGLNGGEGSAPVGGAAPIGGGVIILASLALGYVTRKIYNLRKNILD